MAAAELAAAMKVTPDAAKLAAAVKATVDQAPTLTAAQKNRLALLLGGGQEAS